ncbi:MAG: hypothetical protein H7Y59_04290 [Anaerolineales bacterium]|nr:hypothetical protein [Anaerolineales bacterium]
MIYSLPITILIEGLVCLGYSIGNKKPILSIFITSLLANLITQSLLWIALNIFFQYYLLTLFIAEILIWLIESLIFYRFRFNQLSMKESILLSLIINLSSFGIGWFLPI